MPAGYYPYLNVGGGSYGKGSYWIQHPRHWALDGSLRKTMGKHNLKAGFSIPASTRPTGSSPT